MIVLVFNARYSYYNQTIVWQNNSLHFCKCEVVCTQLEITVRQMMTIVHFISCYNIIYTSSLVFLPLQPFTLCQKLFRESRVKRRLCPFQLPQYFVSFVPSLASKWWHILQKEKKNKKAKTSRESSFMFTLFDITHSGNFGQRALRFESWAKCFIKDV